MAWRVLRRELDGPWSGVNHKRTVGGLGALRPRCHVELNGLPLTK